MNLLQVNGLTKIYPKFQLKEVAFEVEQGRIMGFVGRNGAGKSTTLKSILNIVHPNAGCVKYFGLNFQEYEEEIKQRIGFSGGTVDFYKKKKISDIISVTKRFYKSWDEEIYEKYRDLFSIDEEKTPSQLSQGMNVKLSLLIALSHHAEFLILDEPTSGLDPVSREELLEVFRYLKKQGISILFSTHIISDLDKCADDITYIRNGQIIYTGSALEFAKGKSIEESLLAHEKEAIHEAFDI
ncbi:MAG: ABC transporter ATP-binding protein [Ruminococcaceae bacterium]|nr:ABC transporter ATP-binding protein [Oscillospiraceae bacterium]